MHVAVQRPPLTPLTVFLIVHAGGPGVRGVWSSAWQLCWPWDLSGVMVFEGAASLRRAAAEIAADTCLGQRSNRTTRCSSRREEGRTEGDRVKIGDRHGEPLAEQKERQRGCWESGDGKCLVKRLIEMMWQTVWTGRRLLLAERLSLFAAGNCMQRYTLCTYISGKFKVLMKYYNCCCLPSYWAVVLDQTWLHHLHNIVTTYSYLLSGASPMCRVWLDVQMLQPKLISSGINFVVIWAGKMLDNIVIVIFL